MKHPLDNPVWNALSSGNKHLAKGTDRAKIFDPEVSPFAAVIGNSPENLLELHGLIDNDRLVFLWASKLLSVPQQWKVIACIPGFQMVYEKETVNAIDRTRIMPLSAKHIPEMLALTKLTKPGPFGTKTIGFGNYEGIFENGNLVAMTGRRFHCFDHIEISAVCTHPDQLGKGYAKQLLLSQLGHILNESAKPYLHVKGDNERAIHVYESLGFTVRMPVYFYILQKTGLADSRMAD